jgi:uncharacterized protein YpmB
MSKKRKKMVTTKKCNKFIPATVLVVVIIVLCGLYFLRTKTSVPTKGTDYVTEEYMLSQVTTNDILPGFVPVLIY